jgi:hypothetical protein
VAIEGRDPKESRLVTGRDGVKPIRGGGVTLSALVLLAGDAPGDRTGTDEHVPTELREIVTFLDQPGLFRSDAVEEMDTVTGVHVPRRHPPIGTASDARSLSVDDHVRNLTLNGARLKGLACTLVARRERGSGSRCHRRRERGRDVGVAPHVSPIENPSPCSSPPLTTDLLEIGLIAAELEQSVLVDDHIWNLDLRVLRMGGPVSPGAHNTGDAVQEGNDAHSQHGIALGGPAMLAIALSAVEETIHEVVISSLTSHLGSNPDWAPSMRLTK